MIVMIRKYCSCVNDFNLTGQINLTENTDVQLRGLVDQVRNPPFAFQCAWQADVNAVITFDRLTYSFMFGVEGGSTSAICCSLLTTRGSGALPIASEQL